MDLSSKEKILPWNKMRRQLNQSRFYLNVTDNSPRRYTNGAEETLNKIDRLEECQPLGIYKSPANDMLCVVKFFYSVIR